MDLGDEQSDRDTAMTLNELAMMIGAKVHLNSYVSVSEKVVVTAGFDPHPDVNFKGGRMSTRGVGSTVEEAKTDLCKEFAGKKISFGWPDEANYREFQVPETLEP